MNAHAHLLSLGWAGPGHSLDSRPSPPTSSTNTAHHLANQIETEGTTNYKQKGHRGLAYNPANDPLKVGNTGTGLIKPLAISQRKNKFGIGKKAHEPASGNEWWLKGFQSALQNIGKSDSERSSGVSTPVTGGSVGGGKTGGLYGFFVKGQMMEGTIKRQNTREDEERTSRKRKSDEFEEDNDETSGTDESDGRHMSTNSRNTTQESRTKEKKAAKEEFLAVGAFLSERDKNEKRRKRREKDGDLTQFVQVQEFFQVARNEDDTAIKSSSNEKLKSKKKKRKSEVAELDGTRANGDDGVKGETVETKEERRERRRKRKEEKAKAAGLIVNGDATTNGQDDSEDAAAKAARRAERKRRKAEKVSVTNTAAVELNGR